MSYRRRPGTRINYTPRQSYYYYSTQARRVKSFRLAVASARGNSDDGFEYKFASARAPSGFWTVTATRADGGNGPPGENTSPFSDDIPGMGPIPAPFNHDGYCRILAGHSSRHFTPPRGGSRNTTAEGYSGFGYGGTMPNPSWSTVTDLQPSWRRTNTTTSGYADWCIYEWNIGLVEVVRTKEEAIAATSGYGWRRWYGLCGGLVIKNEGAFRDYRHGTILPGTSIKIEDASFAQIHQSIVDDNRAWGLGFSGDGLVAGVVWGLVSTPCAPYGGGPAGGGPGGPGGGGNHGGDWNYTCDCPDYAKRRAAFDRPRFASEAIARNWANSNAGIAWLGPCKHIYAVARRVGDHATANNAEGPIPPELGRYGNPWEQYYRDRAYGQRGRYYQDPAERALDLFQRGYRDFSTPDHFYLRESNPDFTDEIADLEGDSGGNLDWAYSRFTGDQRREINNLNFRAGMGSRNASHPLMYPGY